MALRKVHSAHRRVGALLVLATVLAPSTGRAEPPVSFARDIQPILSDKCYQCHGPDGAQRKAELRLDSRADAFADRGGYACVVPRNPGESEVFVRVAAEDSESRMPPSKSGKQLTEQQIALIRRWIEQGAKWESHWSFVPPVRPAVPDAHLPLSEGRERGASGGLDAWSRNPIDRFVLARLAKEGLNPAPEAPAARASSAVSVLI